MSLPSCQLLQQLGQRWNGQRNGKSPHVPELAQPLTLHWWALEMNWEAVPERNNTGTGLSGQGPAAPFPRYSVIPQGSLGSTCASSPCVPEVPGGAELLPQGRARLSCETIPARALSCELRGTRQGHHSGHCPDHSQGAFPPLLGAQGMPEVPVPGCSSGTGCKRAPSSHSSTRRVFSLVSNTKQSPTSSCFAISGLLPTLSSFGPILALRICHGLGFSYI